MVILLVKKEHQEFFLTSELYKVFIAIEPGMVVRPKSTE
jgi:hypothetical protein